MPGLTSRDQAREVAPQYFDPITRRPATWVNDSGLIQRMPGRFDIVKGDTWLGNVGDQYRVLNNWDALESLDSLMRDPNGPRYETMGELWGGRVFFALAVLPESITVKGTDEVKPYLFLYNSHDGSSAVKVMLTMVRVVCNNTAQYALSDTSLGSYAARHSGDILGKMANVSDALGLIHAETVALNDLFNRFAECEPTKAQIESILSTLFPATATNRSELQKERVLQLAANGTGNAAFSGTAWSLLNGITELEDHVNNQVTAKSKEDAADSRFRSLLYGSAQARKSKAIDTIREVCLI